MATPIKKVRPDNKGRIVLGKFAKNISSFDISQDEDGRIILTPYKEIPAREAWLYENEEALASVKKGLADSAAGRIKKIDKFFDDIEDEE